MRAWLLAALLVAVAFFLAALYDVREGIVDWAPWWMGF